MPQEDNLIDCLGQAKYITTLDLPHGYWQVPVSVGSCSKMVFATPYGLFQSSVMPFGLQEAPSTFKRMIDRLLWDVNNFAAAYLDDIIIQSKTWEDQLMHVCTILQTMKIRPHRLLQKICEGSCASYGSHKEEQPQPH